MKSFRSCWSVMDGFHNADAIHLYYNPKYTSPFVSFDNDLIGKAKKIGLHADSPHLN